MVSKKRKHIKDKRNPMYGKKHTKETREKMRKNHANFKKENHPRWGQKHSLESIKKMRKPHPSIRGKKHYFYGKHHSEETKKKISQKMSGKNHPWYGKHLPKKTMDKIKKHWRKNGAWHIERMRLGRLASPNKPETTVIKILSSIGNKGFLYSGDGKISLGRFNPDFINHKTKQIIEVYGDYWHNIPKNIKVNRKRKATYKKLGYSLLVIWEHETYSPNKLLIKISKYINNNILIGGENNGRLSF